MYPRCNFHFDTKFHSHFFPPSPLFHTILLLTFRAHACLASLLAEAPFVARMYDYVILAAYRANTKIQYQLSPYHYQYVEAYA